MEKVLATGKSVEEAVQTALGQLGVSKDKVHVHIIEQPSKKFFGLFGQTEAVVEVELLQPKKDPVQEAKTFLEQVLNSMNISVRIEMLNQKDQVIFNLIGKDLGVLIGRRGQTLDSLQYLLNIVSGKHTNIEDRKYILLDAENYRSRRKSALENLAVKLADKALKTGKEVVLEPMSPMERKIIHTRLQNHPRVQTYSQGNEPYRKVIISIK